ncbi:MAG: hypothetical protein JXA54_15735 [Candidatus Heimdallarchaeota archaeon]|nr:hypothetical protein [Candidatus Heimdallarchaeota archaeon]
MAKITIPTVKYTCPNCGKYAQIIGTEPMTCPACGIVVCDKCAQKSFCSPCLSYLTPDEYQLFQQTRFKHGANFFSGFCGVVGGFGFLLVAFITALAKYWIIMGVCIAGIALSILVWWLLEKKRKLDLAEYHQKLVEFAELIKTRRFPNNDLIVNNKLN